MSDFLDEFAGALSERAGHDLDVPEGAKNPVLALARDVAHNSERKNAPLATFLVGRYVESRLATGASARAALDEAIALVENVFRATER